MATKMKWRVAPAPTGRYRSFDKRGWPSLETVGDGDKGAWLLATVLCSDNYYPRLAKIGKHAPLRVRVYNYNGGTGAGRTSALLKGEFACLGDAKAAADRFFQKYPEWLPVEKAS